MEKNKSQPEVQFDRLACPMPLTHKDTVVLSHGSGGRMTLDLIHSVFHKAFDNPFLAPGNDFADVPVGKNRIHSRIVVATDAHIVNPIFFPGGDIGRLAIAGTVNDISMSGGIPRFITASFIIEEGFPISDLEKIAASMQQTAEEAGVQIIAGDTKVAEKGKADKIFISTTGIGFVDEGMRIGGEYAQPGDAVLLSGSIGDHGIAVLAARNELGFRTAVVSDVAPLNHLIQSVLSAAPRVHVLRDPTRGGLGTSLNEIAAQSRVSVELVETAIPVKREVNSACEMLGFDPMYVANEGKVIIIMPESEAPAALQALLAHPLGRDASIIGRVMAADGPARVTMKTQIGGTRIVDMLTGEMLPRIC